MIGYSVSLLTTLHGLLSLSLITEEISIDARDPNVAAEEELIEAAASIEAAAKMLSELKPRAKAVSMEELIICMQSFSYS